MATNSLITLGLAQVLVGEASTSGTMPTELSKIGKVYKGTCKVTQDAAEVTEHFEEGKSAPEIRKKSKKIPTLAFSLMDCDAAALIKYIGGEAVDTNGWGFNGDELNANVAIKVVSEQGFDFNIPNADVEAVINADMSSSGIFLVEFTVTPCAVTAGKAITAIPKA